MVRLGLLITLAAMAPGLASAQTAERDGMARERTIHVAGRGKVATPPDVATIDYWVAGEGETPDDATRALATAHERVRDGLLGLLGTGTEISSGNVMLIETRGAGCEDRGYNAQPRLSEGPCAVTGHLARLQGSVRTSAVDKAGTAVGLAARLGARDARLQQFALSDTGAAQRRAAAAALADARERATAIAADAGVRLGPVLTVSDQMGGPIVVTGQYRPMPIAAPPPPAPPPPIEIDIKPRPIETEAQLFVTYAIEPR